MMYTLTYATPSGQSNLEGEASNMIGLDFSGLGLIQREPLRMHGREIKSMHLGVSINGVPQMDGL